MGNKQVPGIKEIPPDELTCANKNSDIKSICNKKFSSDHEYIDSLNSNACRHTDKRFVCRKKNEPASIYFEKCIQSIPPHNYNNTHCGELDATYLARIEKNECPDLQTRIICKRNNPPNEVITRPKPANKQEATTILVPPNKQEATTILVPPNEVITRPVPPNVPKSKHDYVLYPYTDFMGNDTANYNLDLNGCIDKCASIECPGISHVTSTNGCWLKNNMPGNGTPNDNVHSYKITSNAYLPVKRNYTGFPFTDFWGNDIMSYPNTKLNECLNICTNDEECKGITHVGSTNTCWLKNKMVGNGYFDNNTLNDKIHSYLKSNPQYDTRYDTHPGNTSGNDISGSTLDKIACLNKCNETPDCKGFVHFGNTNHCVLKTKMDGNRTIDKNTIDNKINSYVQTKPGEPTRNWRGYPISKNGRCGTKYSNTACPGKQCCSTSDWCGGTTGGNDDWCKNPQNNGIYNAEKPPNTNWYGNKYSPDDRCGTNGLACKNKKCCSQNGLCSDDNAVCSNSHSNGQYNRKKPPNTNWAGYNFGADGKCGENNSHKACQNGCCSKDGMCNLYSQRLDENYNICTADNSFGNYNTEEIGTFLNSY